MSIANVCIGVCKIHEEYLVCKGCLRSRLEIVKWNKGSDTDKLAIIQSIEAKRAVYGDLQEGI
jgi:predicted Fe-S protein YdhL (DUF1289 family)